MSKLEILNRLNSISMDLLISAVKIEYYHEAPTKLALQIKESYPDTIELPIKNIAVTYNGFEDKNHFEQYLNKKYSYLKTILTIYSTTKDLDIYKDEFSKTIGEIRVWQNYRYPFYSRNDSQIRYSHHFKFDKYETDSDIDIYQQMQISDFVKIQLTYLKKLHQLLTIGKEQSEVIENIEDLIPSNSKREHLKKWLIENDYCDDSFVWTHKTGPYKSKVACLLSYVILLKGFTDKKPNDDEIFNVARNTFKITFGKDTLRDAPNNSEIRAEFKNLKI